MTVDVLCLFRCGAIRLSAFCYCDISWSYSLTFSSFMCNAQLANYMGPIWVPYGHPYGSHMGCPYGTQIGSATGFRMGPIWAQYGHTHLGLPRSSPYGIHICMFVGCIETETCHFIISYKYHFSSSDNIPW